MTELYIYIYYIFTILITPRSVNVILYLINNSVSDSLVSATQYLTETFGVG